MLNDRLKYRGADALFETEKMLSSLRRNGYVIVEDVLGTWELDRLKDQIEPELEKCPVEDDNKFMGNQTKRFGRLMWRIPASQGLATHPVMMDCCNHFLLDYSPTYQIHFTGVMHVMPGQKEQKIHQDIYPFGNPCAPLVIAAMWALTDFTKENGATLTIPGSHLWDQDRESKESERVVAEMPAGSVLIYFANTHHGAGSNVTEATNRTGLNIQYSVSWLRQEENQYLAVPLEAAREMPQRIQELLGYDLASRHWGYVDQVHPMKFLESPEDYGVGGVAPKGLDFCGKIRLDVRENGIWDNPKKEEENA